MQLNCYFRSASCMSGLTQKWLRVMTSRKAGRHRSVGKFLLAMKITAVLLLAAGLSVSAAVVSQDITYSGKNVSLQKIFSVIEQQTGYVAMTSAELLASTHPVTIDVKQMPLDNFLALIFTNQPVTFSLDDKNIILTKKTTTVGLNPRLSEEDFSRLTNPPITGIIRDAEGNPIAGVNVVIKGSKKGVTTDANGKFSIEAGINEVLVISSVGYNATELKIDNANAPLFVALQKSISPLDEVQIIAYGTTTKRLNTGNITTVTAEEIAQQPVTNPLLALQGRVPGMVITQGTGMPNSSVKVTIQGQNSMLKGNIPFYVIDGVPYPSSSINNLNGLLDGSAGNGNNPLAFINPNDIERIDILKDADATAIYGSQAANGAILITTKKGKSGRTNVNIDAETGIGQMTSRLKLMNTQQYLQMRREAQANFDLPVNGTPGIDHDLALWDTMRYTDWQKELLGGNAQYHNIQASVSGGTDNTNFMVSTMYSKETTILPGDFNDRKGSARVNLNHVSINRRFRLSITGSYMGDQNNLPITNLMETATRLAPDAPSLYNADGSLNWAPDQNGNSSWNNPISFRYSHYNINTSNLLSNAQVGYEILRGLEVSSSFGFSRFSNDEISYSTIEGVAPEYHSWYQSNRSSSFANQLQTSWIIEPQATYKGTLGKGRFQALLGSTFRDNRSERTAFFSNGYSSDNLLTNISFATSVRPLPGVNTNYRYSAVFGRFNYAWDNKYILTLNARRDGSSRFGSNNMFNNFWSVAGAWIFSDETFFSRNLPFISFGKLNVSYGTTGNDQIGDYQFLSTYNVYNAAVGYQGSFGLRPMNIPNPYLEWEETRKLNASLDLGFFDQRLQINADYYFNRSSNQLLQSSLSDITGFPAITKNLSALVQNSGLELMVTSINVKKKNFTWSSGLNFTIQRNKLMDYPGLENSFDATIYKIGYPIDVKWLYRFAGVDPSTGSYQFYDKDGKLVGFPGDQDRTIFISSMPSFYGGFSNSFIYKHIQLDFLFEFRKQKAQNIDYGYLPGAFSNDGSIGNQRAALLNRWQKEGDIKPYAKFADLSNQDYFAQYLLTNSDAMWQDASFIRLRNISLSWDLPQPASAKIRLQRLRIFCHAQNLLLFTKYIGIDPETGGLSLPPLRRVTIGFKAGI